ncbi:hypothetical protein QF205_10815 [Luteimonas composti]|uniref:Uncharacterized protein n=1 Tax=Luteimonas composti TaxID=398257 RepID=A0ABT6MTW7_9GAMM|nr:hypothetical protein [Luteimonas composti]MDH7453553.1 hypothetical protein [Luteimonas composti]
MIPPITAEDLVLLREGLRALGIADGHAINLTAKESQSASQSRMLVKLGNRQRHRQELDFRLRERLAQLTGMPEILHGNADLASESTLYPLTHDQQAQEANFRG